MEQIFVTFIVYDLGVFFGRNRNTIFFTRFLLVYNNLSIRIVFSLS